MSKITVTTIAGLTSGGDANTVKIESGDAFQVVSGATTLGGTLGVTGVSTLTGNVGIGITPDTISNGKSIQINRSLINDDDGGSTHITQNGYYNSAWKYVEDGTAEKISFVSGTIRFDNASSNSSGADASLSWSERMRIDSSGNLLVGKTSQGLGNSGVELREGSASGFTRDNTVMDLNRTSSDGQIVRLRKDGTTLGSIGATNGGPFIANVNHGGINFATSGSQARPVPCNESGAYEDDLHDFGDPAVRWDNIYASNGSIQTSDQNEKQDIASATAKELNVAKKLSALFKTFRWKSKVAEKGDKTRTHSGIIAQDIQSAFSAEGLDASKYGLFCSDTWWEKDKNIYNTEEEAPKDAIKKTRLGVRYPELFSFIFSSIEARLTALESK